LIRRGEDGEPMRGENGFCQKAATGEPGEAIGRILEGASRFEGYSDKAATAKKIFRNVFEAGDVYVRTGDLMRQDGQGFFYFVDRLGDTFRWKGENVATTEVAAALTQFPGIIAANVYGVSVPGADGKAGMAGLETGPDFRIDGLKAHLEARLPGYARPLFLRLVRSFALTETFKPKKNSLAEEGYNPAGTTDILYADLGDGYVPLDEKAYERINSGLVRF
jgi:fatty-acyl-CoA synthase